MSVGKLSQSDNENRTPAPTDGELPPPSPGLSQFVQSDLYGTPGQIAATAVEGALRGATLGASDIAETQLGISTPEARRARMEENPGTAIGSNVLGGAGLVAATGGLAAPAEGAALASGVGPVAARALGYGAEGAVFGAGNAVTDEALGDPDLNAQKVLAHIGFGAALGAGLGVLSKGIEAIPAMRRSAQAADSVPPDGGAPPPVVDAPMNGVQPTSFEEMSKRVDDATKYGGQTIEMPEKSVLEDAASRIEMANPIHPLQIESLESQDKKNLYNAARELPGKEGQAIRDYEAVQKNELVSKADNTIKDVSPVKKITSDATQGGNEAIDAFTDQYQTEKDALKPFFQELKANNAGENIDNLSGVVEKFSNAVPGVARMFDNEGGNFDVLPYKSAWGIDRATYNAVKEAVESLKEVPGTLEELQNIRRGLDQHVDVMAQGPAPSQIRALKAAMMDHMQAVLDNSGASTELRDVFRRYAINEQQRGVIEKVFGASVGSPEFGAISKVKPEIIGDRIFGNTANVKAAKAILPPDKFNQILGNWLAESRAAATDKGVFSSNKFGSFLRKNQDSLNEAFRDMPGALQRLRDITTISRILPDAPSINPSGTAKTLMGAFKDAHGIYDVVKNVANFAKDKFQEGQIRLEISAALAGKADQQAKLHTIDGILNRIGNRIETGAKAVLNSPASKSGALSGAALMSNDAYDKNVSNIKKMISDPTAMMDHLSKSTDAMYAAAPNITQSLHNSMIAGVQFLNSKIPAPSDQMPLSDDWKPSKSQRYTFDSYYRTVEDPLSALEDVKNQILTNESLEALSAVHPALLQEMRSKIVEQLDPEKAKKLPYPAKLSLSKFLGQPLDQNMLPQSIMASQSAINAPQMGNQSAPQSGRKSTLGGLKQLQASSRVATRTQDVQDS